MAGGGVHYRTGQSQGYDIASYPSSYTGAGSSWVEWKVNLSDMGDLTGRFLNSYIHNLWPGTDPPPYEVSDRNDSCVQVWD